MVKTLFLVRHAKSSWSDPALSDFERPLNARGERDAPFMAQRFVSKKNVVDGIISSPATRAVTTAKYFAAALKMEVHLEPKIYDASLKELLAIINTLPSKMSSVMLFGHNPGFSDLASYISSGSIVLPTCAVVRLTLDIGIWDELISGVGRVDDLDYPKLHFS